ncbi:MAG: DUF4093 domain-containing protein [Ruminococcaceae bacterium]|nr:DUF4093 domain-containing protein [Oscillospiraceae bacterium]
MLKIKEAIVVEGTYDKAKLSRLVDTTIVTTDGFDLFKNPSKAALIRRLAASDGIVVLTDSDRAGFQIRNYIKNITGGMGVKHAYIPDIHGKEKRKAAPSKEGFLGVEGVSDQLILDALAQAGCEGPEEKNVRLITKSDLYADGLSGGDDARYKRLALTRHLNLPARISANMLLEVLNREFSYEQYKQLIEKL